MTATDPPVCPCCAGEHSGGWWDLCDTCLSAALAGRYPHGCARPEPAGEPGVTILEEIR